MMLAMMMAVTFVGCNKDDDPDPIDPAAPVVTINGGTIITIDIRDLSALAVPVSVTSADADLTSIKVSIQVDDNTPVLLGEPITDFGETPKVWAKTYTIADINIGIFEGLDPDMALTFIVEANIADKQTTEKADVQIIGWPTPLEGPEAFTWERSGNPVSTSPDLKLFGLEWKTNTGTHIVITPADGTKLVELTVNDWTSIETKEALAAIVEQMPEINKWEAIPAKADFNYVIATKTKEGKYFLINPTKRDIDQSDPGHRIVTGKYKK